MDHRFQVDLRGIIELLSNHLYSGPQVYVRELLQNGVDAIRARVEIEPGLRGSVRVEVAKGDDGRPMVVVSDDGIGLTSEEIHRFLATIGESSKRRADGARTDFIGQFGIGLLSCFVVSDEIVVVTCSARVPGGAVEWRGRPDGTYSMRALDAAMEPGTRVTLRAKEGSEEWFEPETVRRLAAHYGGLLPIPIHVASADGSRCVNEDGPPWRATGSPSERRRALLEYGQRTFGIELLDAVPLRSDVGAVEGVAYVLPYSPSLAGRRTHRVYLKGMLLAEEAPGLLPEWAFFVKCVVNADALRPTASREAFYEDQALSTARDRLGDCLRAYLLHLARNEPARLRLVIGIHHLSIKALCAHDDECLELFAAFLPFETSLGTMTLIECRERDPVVRYVANLDEFRQIAAVAASQGLCVVNAAYIYDAQLIERAASVIEGIDVEAVSASSITEALDELTLSEREDAFDLIEAAEKALEPFRCAVEVRRFRPRELPALYSRSQGEGLWRGVERTKEVASSGLWSGVLDGLAAAAAAAPGAKLCFNYDNPLIRKLARLDDAQLLALSIKLLYVQSLLLGHHPLLPREMALLNEGLLGIIDWGVDQRGPGGLLQ
jgi:molecular chaperone HtpG